MSKVDLSDQELLRYSRQIMLPRFDVAGQLALVNAKVLILGLGGLGSPVAMYLASAGVGALHLADFDVVDDSNLQRQIAHQESRIGMAKVDSAKQAIEALNQNTQVTCYNEKLDGIALENAIAQVDLVLDCTDNFSTRFEINRACLKARKPLVSGAAIRMEGQIMVFDPRQEDSPCYQCLYPDLSDEQLSCSESGVMAPLVGVIGSMQALEAIKVLSNTGKALVGRVLIFDATYAEWRQLKLKKDPKCPSCSKV